MAELARKGNAIRQRCCFPYCRHPKTYSCKGFSYDLNAPACRISLHLCPGSEAPDTQGSSFDFRFLLGLHLTDRPATQVTLPQRLPKMRGAIPSQCSMMWATISKATIPRVARDAANTKRVRRFSSVVIIARWKPTSASILSFRACQRV